MRISPVVCKNSSGKSNLISLFKVYAVEQLFQNYKSQDEYQRLMNNESPKNERK